MKRREFLRAAAAAAVAACEPVVLPSPPPPVTAAPSASPAPTSAPPIVAPDWSALAREVRQVIRPTDAGYDGARVLYNTRFDGIRPEAIARCMSVDEVRASVTFAGRHALPVSVRSGGHSYGGWSTGTGLVIDTGALGAISVGAGTVTVGAGARLIDLYAALASNGVGIAAGSCPTVGVAGLTLGGGLGVLSRAWGLTCDSLVSAEIVTADGRVLTCDERREPELFWALRGAGMASFGVVTSLVLRTRSIATLALGFLEWSWQLAGAVIAAWQDWMARAPDALWSNVHLETVPQATPSVRVHVVFLGDRADLDAQIDALVRSAGAPSDRSSATFSYDAAMLIEAGCFGRTLAQCHLRGEMPEAQLDRETYAAKSLVISSPLAATDIGALTIGMERLAQTPNAGSGAVIVDALGGAVARVAPDATAFPHRGALAVAQLIASWSAGAPQTTVDAQTGWLRQLHGMLSGPLGGAYANYADPDLPNWPRAYYGANYPRLQRVKAMYDPSELFTFPQAIRPR